nr:hypothetical protein Iba_chr01bCG3290 [Ipomoea batatas]
MERIEMVEHLQTVDSMLESFRHNASLETAERGGSVNGDDNWVHPCLNQSPEENSKHHNIQHEISKASRSQGVTSTMRDRGGIGLSHVLPRRDLDHAWPRRH